jgi:hypothetical protein
MKKVFVSLSTLILALTMTLSNQTQAQQNPCSPKAGDKKMATCNPKHEKGASCNPKATKAKGKKDAKTNPCAPKKGSTCAPK